jgi:hypothetical protein
MMVLMKKIWFDWIGTILENPTDCVVYEGCIVDK